MLTNRQLATVLAALRYWQRTTTHQQRSDPNFKEHPVATEDGTIEPLRDDQIDTLCECLHTQSQFARYVLYDFDSHEPATTVVYSSYDDAKEDAEQFDQVLIVKLSVEAVDAEKRGEDILSDPPACPPILPRLAGIASWREVPEPQTGCGLDYWYTSADGRGASINIDGLSAGATPERRVFFVPISVARITCRSRNQRGEHFVRLHHWSPERRSVDRSSRARLS